jgi:hypothetical protein
LDHFVFFFTFPLGGISAVFLSNVNVVKQFYSYNCEPGSIGDLPGCHSGSIGIIKSVSVAKSAMVGMDRDETVYSWVSTGINLKYTGLPSALAE